MTNILQNEKIPLLNIEHKNKQLGILDKSAFSIEVLFKLCDISLFLRVL